MSEISKAACKAADDIYYSARAVSLEQIGQWIQSATVTEKSDLEQKLAAQMQSNSDLHQSFRAAQNQLAAALENVARLEGELYRYTKIGPVSSVSLGDFLMAMETKNADLARQLEEAALSTHRQAICIQECAAYIGSETPATITGLPLAVKNLATQLSTSQATSERYRLASLKLEGDLTEMRRERDALHEALRNLRSYSDRNGQSEDFIRACEESDYLIDAARSQQKEGK